MDYLKGMKNYKKKKKLELISIIRKTVDVEESILLKIYKKHLEQIAYDLENNVQPYDYEAEILKLNSITFKVKRGL